MDTILAFLILCGILAAVNVLGLLVFLGVLHYITRRGSPSDAG